MSSDKKEHKFIQFRIENVQRTKTRSDFGTGSTNLIIISNYYYYYHVKLIICVCQIKIVIGACNVSVCQWAIFRQTMYIYRLAMSTICDKNLQTTTCAKCHIYFCALNLYMDFFYGYKIPYKWVDNSILCHHNYSIQNVFKSSNTYRKRDHVEHWNI